MGHQETDVRPRLPPAWRIGLAGVAAQGATFGFARYGYGLFLPEIRDQFQLSVSLIGLISSATYFSYLVALLAAGALAGRLGPRPLVVAGGVSAAGGMLLVAFADRTLTLTAGLLIAGLSPGFAWAPFSDAVDRAVPSGQRERVMALIPSGTAFAGMIAGPLALLARGSAWQYAWTAFAVLALVVTVYNARVLPGGPHPRRGRRAAAGAEHPADGTDPTAGAGDALTGPAPENTFGPSADGSSGEGAAPRGQARAGLLPRAREHRRATGARLRRLLCTRAAVPLYCTALAYGMIGAFYWTYAVDLVSRGLPRGDPTGPLFWTLLGVAGTAGLFTGALLTRLGLRGAQVVLFWALATAIALLGIAPDVLTAVAVSAILYGPAFMAISGLLAVWSYQVFPERPSTGLSAAILFLGVGTLAGPITLGAVATGFGLRRAFLGTALLALLILLARPLSRSAVPAQALPADAPPPAGRPMAVVAGDPVPAEVWTVTVTDGSGAPADALSGAPEASSGAAASGG